MASKAQINANRRNATLSTGPADSSRTRFNGLAHGLTSKQSVIRGESLEEYDTFAKDLLQNLNPLSSVESVLADRVIAAAWRLKRFTRIETSFFNDRIDAILQADPDRDPDSALAAFFTDPAEMGRMRLFLRYQTAVQREYDKAYKELQKARAERVETESEATIEPVDRELARSLAELHRSLDAPIGFASQDSPGNSTENVTIISARTDCDKAA